MPLLLNEVRILLNVESGSQTWIACGLQPKFVQYVSMDVVMYIQCQNTVIVLNSEDSLNEIIDENRLPNATIAMLKSYKSFIENYYVYLHAQREEFKEKFESILIKCIGGDTIKNIALRSPIDRFTLEIATNFSEFLHKVLQSVDDSYRSGLD